MSERVNEEKKSPANGTKPGGSKPDGTSDEMSGDTRGATSGGGLAGKPGAKSGGSPVAAAKAEAVLPTLGPLGMLRWAWTQLTSMRTALFLLLMLAVAAVPGSLFPQRPANPSIVTQYIKDNPDYGKILDSLQLYDVYSSAWFSAIYILLFISLIGCVVPRAIAHYKAMRSQPPRTPARLSRLPEYGTLVIPAGAGIPASRAIDDAAGLLKKRGYRVDVRDRDGARPSIGAERGFLREVGNLVFHTSLIGVLVSVAIGGLFGYSGQRILVEGDTFVNTLVGYDQFTPGTNFQSSQLQPYSVQLDKFQITFDRESQGKIGQPIDFQADVTTKESPDAPAQERGAEGQRPAHPRRHQHVPHRQRLRPGRHHPRRRRQHRHAGAGGGQAAGRQLLLLRGHQGPRRQAGAARLRRLLPAHRVRHRGRRVLQRRPGAVQPAADPELVLRRPRPGRRRPAERLRTRRQEAHPAQRPQPRRRRHHPLAGRQLHPPGRQGHHQLRRREALHRRRHPPQPGPALRPDLRAAGGGRPGHLAVREPPPRLGPDRNPRGRPHHGRIRSPGPRRGPPARRRGRRDPQAARRRLGSRRRRRLPVGSQRGADNDRADTKLPGAGAGQASPDHPAADFIQSTAGSSESKKEQ